MSDMEPSPEPRARGKSKKKIKRGSTFTAKSKSAPDVGLDYSQNNFSSQLHMLGNDEDATDSTAQAQMERKLARLRFKGRRTTPKQRQSAPTTPRRRSKRATTSTATTTTRTDDFADPFFTTDPFDTTRADAPTSASPSPAPRTRPPSSVPIALERNSFTTSSVALAPPAPITAVSHKAATRPKRSHTLPTLSLSQTSAPNAIDFASLDDPFESKAVANEADDDVSDLSMFFSYSAPVSRRTSIEAPYMSYQYPNQNPNPSGSVVYVPVPVYATPGGPQMGVAGGVPYQTPQMRQVHTGTYGGYSRPVPAAAAGYGYVQQTQPVQYRQQAYPYPVTPPRQW